MESYEINRTRQGGIVPVGYVLRPGPNFQFLRRI
jgi:hypothetical protein